MRCWCLIDPSTLSRSAVGSPSEYPVGHGSDQRRDPALPHRRRTSSRCCSSTPAGRSGRRRTSAPGRSPRGTRTRGRTRAPCALRELGEELGSGRGLAADDLIELGSVRQKGGKLVHAWAAEGEFDPAELRSNSFAMEWPPRSGTSASSPRSTGPSGSSRGGARRRSSRPGRRSSIGCSIATYTRRTMADGSPARRAAWHAPPGDGPSGKPLPLSVRLLGAGVRGARSRRQGDRDRPRGRGRRRGGDGRRGRERGGRTRPGAGAAGPGGRGGDERRARERHGQAAP